VPSGCCAGQRAQAIDELPLDWFFGGGVVLDMSAKAEGEAVDSPRARRGNRRLALGRPAAPSGAGGPRARPAGIYWAARQADLPYAQIERLVSLDELPSTGCEVACFPLRIAGAAPARVVALLTR
jgi:kynurenine formamidase